MGLKSFLIETENAPRRCLISLILLLCCVAVAVWDGGDSYLKNDGQVIYLKDKAVLRQRFDSDTICKTLAIGDSLKVLGIDRSSFGQKWLVETSKREIGWVDASDLSCIRQIVTDGLDKGDTVSVKAEWLGSHIHRYVYINKKGEEKKRSTDDFIPAFDGWSDYEYNRDGRAGVCSNSKFEANAIGKTFCEMNSSFGSPVLLRITPQGMEAQYSWKVFNPSTGEMFSPNVTFGSDSVVTAVNLVNPKDRAASWLKHMPFASTIIDCPLTSYMVRGSRYNAIADAEYGTGMKILLICVIVVVLICYFFWMFFTSAIPVLIMGWLLKYPKVFAVISDGWLKLLMFCVTIVSVYVWSVMMMAWGMFPFWSVLILIFGWYSFTLAASPLCQFPHLRCPKCHRLYSIKFDHRDFEYSEVKKGSDVVRGKLLGKRTATWEAWTQVTTTYKYGDGHTEQTRSREDVHTNAQDYRTYEYISYDVTYRLDHYRLYYKCEKCGLIEETTAVSWTEIDRKEASRYAHETVHGDVYRKGW